MGKSLEKRIDRLIKYMEYKGLNDNRVTKECGLSQGLIGQARAGKSDLSATTLEKILEKYQDINSEWLSYGYGEMLKEDENKAVSKTEMRPRYDMKAWAGQLTEYIDESAEMVAVIPQIPKYDFTIRITGDSMEPEYRGGDEVACLKVPKGNFIQWGKVYVLNTSQGAVIKRLYKGKKGYKCVSDNKRYGEFEIPEDEIYSINLVVGMVRIY